MSEMTPEEKKSHMDMREKHKAEWNKKTDAEKAAWHKEHGNGEHRNHHGENPGVVPPAAQ